MLNRLMRPAGPARPARLVVLAFLLLAWGVAGAGLVFAGGSSEKSTPSHSAAGGYNPNATIDIGSLYEPQNLDNTAGGGQGVTQALQGNVYESLFKLTDNGKVKDLLATGYTVSPDRLTYTIHLRKGVTFHSGQTLTSADVKFSLEHFLAPNSKASRKSSLKPIESITTTGKYTVVIKLSSRSISLPYNLSYVWIFYHGAKNLATSEDGTGPYKLVQWRRGSTLTLARYADYWGKRPTNKTVVFHYYTNATSLSNALLTGEVDVITSVQSPDLLKQFENNPSFTVREGHSTTKLVLAFNDRVAPFNKASVRTAITQAINKKKLLHSIWGTYGMVIGSFVPPSDPWYQNFSKVNAYDPAHAKKLLAQAGYPHGFTFTLQTPNYSPHPLVAQFIKAQLAKIGVTVNIHIITANEWYTKVYQAHDFAATLQEHVNDRDLVFYGDPNFYWGYKNPKVTRLMAQAEQTKTSAERNKLMEKANRIIVDDAASDWLYLYPQIVVSKSTVSGYLVNELNSQFFAYNIKKA